MAGADGGGRWPSLVELAGAALGVLYCLRPE